MVEPVSGARWPTSGAGAFGFRRSPTHTHWGVDLAAKVGTPVWAVADGYVTHSVEPGTAGFSGYGRTIVVQSGNRWRLYGHLDRRNVNAGERVVAGQQLGTVGASCGTVEQPELRCKGAHLHFELAPRPYPQRPKEAPRLNPSEEPMPDTERKPPTQQERDSWESLNQLFAELLESMPPAVQAMPEVKEEWRLWRKAYDEAMTGFFGLSDRAFAYWIDHYNVLRNRAKSQGLEVPPAARRGATWDENLVTAAREGVTQPLMGGLGLGLVLVVAALLWSRK
jgi:hypothetical protein